MDRNTVKYLAEFLEKLDGGYGENVDVTQFCLDADAEKLDITDDLSWLDDFETVINKPLQRVLAKPHLHVKYVKETVNKRQRRSRPRTPCWRGCPPQRSYKTDNRTW